MKFELPPLPYEKDELEPHIGAETLEYHYEKHHRGYLKKLQKAIEGTPQAGQDLDAIVRGSEGSVFDNAAQVWNHTFYWRSMRPQGGGEPGKAMRAALEAAFGSMDAFRSKFIEVAKGQFGSGYVWLCRRPRDGRLLVYATHDAHNPLVDDLQPLLTADLWEHAYYLDYRNDRGRYVQTFLDHVVDWNFAQRNWERGAEKLRRSA
jgi:superoxide dismutase, Fe-Mn family